MPEGTTLRIALAAPAKVGALETFIAAHVRLLRDVVLQLCDGALPTHEGNGTSLMRSGFLGRSIDRAMSLPDGGSLNALLRRRLAVRLRAVKADVLLAEYANTGEEMAAVCARAGIPYVVHFHGYDAYRHRYVQQFNGYRRIFNGAAALVVVSRHMQQQLIALGASPEKVVYNPYGVDVDHFRPNTGLVTGPHFIAVGRFTPKKAPLRTLDAFRTVLAQRPEARLTMVGDGVLLTECRNMVREAHMEHAVSLPGRLAPKEIAGLMASSLAFVQHSVVAPDNDHEGTPLAVLEAMACALPVVSTRHAGIPDVVEHGVRGMLGAEHDVAAMAANMLYLLDDPANAAAMGRAGRAYVEQHHDVVSRVAALQRILQRAADGLPQEHTA